jgi:glycosyltransferase involved in cell wall biosynthesis
MDHTIPKISIIIPNLNSPIIDRTLESVLHQDSKHDFEVIVVGMDQYNLVEQFEQVTFLQTPSPIGAAEARNIGIRHAQGEWLLFIDSDCIAEADWINTFAREFEAGRKVIGGGVITPKEPFWLLVYNLSMFYGELASQKEKFRKFMPTLNLAVHRKVIEDVGMMNEELPRGQDIEWTSRMSLAGYKLFFNPTAMVKHVPERKDFKTLRAFVRKSGYYMIRVRLKYPGVFNTPDILQNPLLWRLGAPIVAGYITLKIFFQTKEVRQHWQILPFIYLQKFSWCLGAAESLTDLKKENKGLNNMAAQS